MNEENRSFYLFTSFNFSKVDRVLACWSCLVLPKSFENIDDFILWELWNWIETGLPVTEKTESNMRIMKL